MSTETIVQFSTLLLLLTANVNSISTFNVDDSDVVVRSATSNEVPKFLTKLIPDSSRAAGSNRQARRSDIYYSDRYGLSNPSSGRNIKSTSSNTDPNLISDGNTAPTQHNVERRCLRCDAYYYDDRRSPDRRGYDYRGYDDRRYDPNSRRPDYYDYDYDRPTGPSGGGSGYRSTPGRWDDRYLYGNDIRSGYRGSGYDRSRPFYDYDRYDYRYRDPPIGPGGGYPSERDPYYDRYEPRRQSGNNYWDGWGSSRDRYDRYDTRGYDFPSRGYDGFRPWDDTTRGVSGWDNTGRGYYFSSGGRPDPSGQWGGGYDRGYAQGWNYGGSSGGGYRDDWRDRGQYGGRPKDPYYNDRGGSSASNGSTGSRGTSYLYDRDGRPSQLPTTTSRSPQDNNGSNSSNNSDHSNSNNNSKDSDNSG